MESVYCAKGEAEKIEPKVLCLEKEHEKEIVDNYSSNTKDEFFQN